MIESRIGHLFKQRLAERRLDHLEHLATGQPDYQKMVGIIWGLKEAGDLYDDAVRELTGEK